MLLCHRISPRATPPDASHVPAAQQELFHPIRYHSTSQSCLGREKSPICSFRLPRQEHSGSFHHLCPAMALQRCQHTWLSGCTASVVIYTLLWLSQSSCVAKPSLCSASLTTRGRGITPEPQEAALSCNEPFLVCVCGSDGTEGLRKASRTQCEWQNHGFTCCYLAIQPHIQGLFSSWVPQAAQLLSPVLPLTFSKSLQLSSPPLKTWETSLARGIADGIRLLSRGRAPPLPEHVPKRKPLLLGFISPSQPELTAQNMRSV